MSALRKPKVLSVALGESGETVRLWITFAGLKDQPCEAQEMSAMEAIDLAERLLRSAKVVMAKDGAR